MSNARPIRLYFDSGAFSAWKRNDPIPVQDYIEFLQQYPQAAGYVSLDVIPGQPGKARTQADSEKAAEAGWKNYRAMRRAGLDPIPVYHIGERRYWLDKMLGEGATFIGLGGVAGERDSVRIPWLDEVFSYLCGDCGWPEVKVHGFGITSPELLHRYPWFSSDSFSWAFYAAYGFSIVPRFKPGGEPDYTASPYTIGFGKGSRSGKVHKAHLAGNHYSVLGPATKKYVLTYLEREGFTVEQLHSRWTYCAQLTLRFFKRCIAAHRMHPYTRRQGGFFRTTSTRGCGRPDWRYRMIFTENTSYDQSRLLHEEGIDDRLVSYIYFRDNYTRKAIKDVPTYIRTGLIRGQQRVRLRVRLEN